MSAVLVSVAALASACGSSTDAPASALKQPSPSSSTTAAPHLRAKPAVDPIAPPFTPAVRDGHAAHPSISAPHQPFTKVVSYPDHIDLAVLSMSQSVTGGRGPGVLPGRAMTTLRVRFTNGSTKAVDMNEVVVTVVYGADRRLASPVYQDDAADFHDTIAPGHSTVATYEFAIPQSGLGNVTMTVDFDGLHAAATFTGAVK